jgi:hypothetical protein
MESTILPVLFVIFLQAHGCRFCIKTVWKPVLLSSVRLLFFAVGFLGPRSSGCEMDAHTLRRIVSQLEEMDAGGGQTFDRAARRGLQSLNARRD